MTEWFLKAFAIVGVVFLFATIGALPVMLMVNYLFTPEILKATFGVTALTFWKALWLNVLIGWCFQKSGGSSRNDD